MRGERRLKRIGDLDIAQDLEHERRKYTAERVGWTIAVLVLLGSLLGLFGEGILSHGRLGEPGSRLKIDYRKFARRQSDSELTLTFNVTTAGQKSVRFWLGERFLQAVSIQSIEPQPQSNVAAGNRLIYAIAILPVPGTSTVRISFRPDRIGFVPTDVGLESGPEFHFWQFVYP